MAIKMKVKPKPLPPFYAQLVRELYRDYGRVFSRDEIEDVVRQFQDKGLMELLELRDQMREVAFNVEVLSILEEKRKAWDAANRKFPKHPEGLKECNQRWLNIMLYLKNKGFSYYTAKETADGLAFEGNPKDPYRYFDPEKRQLFHVKEPEFIYHPEVNKWRKDETDPTQRSLKIMTTFDRHETEMEAFKTEMKPILTRWIKDGLSNKQILEKLELQFSSTELQNEAMNLMYRLRQSGVKPLVTKKFKVVAKKTEDAFQNKFDNTVMSLIQHGLTDDEIVKRIRSDPELGAVDGPELDLWVGRIRILRDQMKVKEKPHVETEEAKGLTFKRRRKR